MTAQELVYRFNAPRMIHETVDTETVAIDSETGVYFSITGSGYLIVQALDRGAGAADLTAGLAGAFGMDPAVLRPRVDEFLTRLLAEELIVPAREVASASAAADADASAGFAVPDGEAFAPPVLEKFTDMNDILLMDPIHEVSDSGWPHRR